MTRARICLLVALALAGLAPRPAAAQTDSTAVAPLPAATTSPKVTSTFTRTGEETDRFEIGGGLVKGHFDAVGSFGYRRLVAEGSGLQTSFMGEATGGKKDQLTEGAIAAYVLVRPLKSYRSSWKIRPLVEIGPAAHLVVQAASLEGLNKTRYKAQVYLKTHVYVGVEALATRRFGLVLRGRLSTPSHRPLDYAQAAILLR